MARDQPWYDRRLADKYSLRLKEQLYQEPREALPVIVMLKNGVGLRDEEIHQSVYKFGGVVHRQLPVIGGFSALVPIRFLAEIGPHEKVRRVHLDRRVHTCLDIAIPSILADQVQTEGHTGHGVTIAVLDSGIHPHPDFLKPASRLIGWHDVVNGRGKPYDDHGHGTHVAGIAVGNGYASDGRYRGVAPSANLVAIKVADAEGSAPMSRVIEGLQWVLDHQDDFKIRIVNLSLGSEPSEPYKEDPLCQAVEEVWRKGIVVVVAAGNDGPTARTIDTPGNDPYVITVGAIDDRQTKTRNDDLVPDFSSRGPTNDGLRKPDLLAPGVDIKAPQTGGGYIKRTGTSMATPFVTGAAALVLEGRPDLVPDQVKKLLRASAEDWQLLANTEGVGYLHVGQLLRLRDAKMALGRQTVKTNANVRNGSLVTAGVRPTIKKKLHDMAKRYLHLPFGISIMAGLL